ncbi:hypothetical protein CDN99_18430 [Roseateles aquatilis]|uniref:Uncharacterized protein n=1 Tax=Roseateles aquatilis TaxID=431061 RepID=A0A246J528_9BURK|nr:type II toxin-antitoxin system PemK/MazF family toxin [Roseateles aquatilis]OWQ87572.1 hypothetical protein CDN99_18430 [Roseateles aquatilis]
MAISFTPKVGQVLECNFGQFTIQPDDQGHTDFNVRIPPEMIKNRLVVVLNGRLNRQSCIVVPLSRTQDVAKSSSGIHVEIVEDAICELSHFTRCVRWAKADIVQPVSSRRLRLPRDFNGPVQFLLSRSIVERVQRAAVKAINAGGLLIPGESQFATLVDVQRLLKPAA